jgi:hypothetical protein
MDPASNARTTGLRTIRAAGVAGLVFSGLLTSALIVLRLNQAGSVDGTIGVGDGSLIALYLIPFAGIAFLWFLAVLRRRIGRSEDQFFATVFLGSGLLFIAMLFAADATASAAITAARLRSALPGDPAFVFGKALAEALFYVFAVKMGAVFMLVSSNIGRRTGFLPRWFIVLGGLGAVVMLVSVGFFEPLAVIFPAWVAIVSVLLLRAHADSWTDT